MTRRAPGRPEAAPPSSLEALPDSATATTASGVWRPGGWLAAARVCVSPNYSPRPAGATVSLVLLHSISLPPGEYGGDAVERLFTNCLDWDAHPYFQRIRGLRVSAHFLIRRDGGLVQFVSTDERAWHAGASAWRGRDNCNDYSVGIELEGLEGAAFADAQYRALLGVLPALKDRHPLDAVAGHEHVAPGRKHDPGSGFDWPRLVSGLAWPDVAFPS